MDVTDIYPGMGVVRASIEQALDKMGRTMDEATLHAVMGTCFKEGVVQLVDNATVDNLLQAHSHAVGDDDPDDLPINLDCFYANDPDDPDDVPAMFDRIERAQADQGDPGIRFTIDDPDEEATR